MQTQREGAFLHGQPRYSKQAEGRPLEEPSTEDGNACQNVLRGLNSGDPTGKERQKILPLHATRYCLRSWGAIVAYRPVRYLVKLQVAGVGRDGKFPLEGGSVTATRRIPLASVIEARQVASVA